MQLASVWQLSVPRRHSLSSVQVSPSPVKPKLHAHEKLPIVFVQVAAAHRPAAFAACEFVMDYLKTDAVLWKRERVMAGERWIEATGDDRRRLARWKTEPVGDS